MAITLENFVKICRKIIACKVTNIAFSLGQDGIFNSLRSAELIGLS